MTAPISLQKLRDNQGAVPYDETVRALVEAAEAAHEWMVAPEGEDETVKLVLLQDTLARFDFGDDRAL